MMNIALKKSRPLCALLFALCFAVLSYADEFYWEHPQRFSPKNGQFLKTASNKNVSAVIWEEAAKTTGGENVVYISAAVYSKEKWNIYERISEPIPYAESVPSLASVTIGNDNSILIAAVKNRNTIIFLKSEDEGKTFERKYVRTELYDLLSPYLSVGANGKYLLFISHGADEKFSIYSSSSADGFSWDPLTELNLGRSTNRAFLPVHTAAGKNDVIVFQASDLNDKRQLYALFSSYSSDGGATWSKPAKITPSGDYQNQRPDILYLNRERRIAVVWERNHFRQRKNEAAFMKLGFRGEPVSELEQISEHSESVFNPKIALYRDAPFIAWTSESNGKSNLYIATKQKQKWSAERVRNFGGTLLFACLFSLDNHLQLLWQEGNITQNIMRISPDDKVGKPKLMPIGFGTKTEGNKQKIAVRIGFPHDASGIAGYSFKWSKDKPPAFVEPQIQKLPDETTVTYEPEEDGTWYLGVRVADYAGNWSDMAVVSYERDIVPPAPPVFELLALDKNGFVSSNTFTLEWSEPKTDIAGKSEAEIKGYIWNIHYLGSAEKYKQYLKDFGVTSFNDATVQAVMKNKFKTANAGVTPNTKALQHYFDNYENGLYAFTVSAVDESGNIGEPGVKYFALNKYKPYTYISNIESKQLQDGTIVMSVIGKGFTSGGEITSVYIDKDGQPPYDLVIPKDKFNIINDRLISGIEINDLDTGEYLLGLGHSVRGIYFTKKPITIDDYGNVKFGDYSKNYDRDWNILTERENIIDSFAVIVIIVCIIFVIILSFAVITGTAREAAHIKKEVTALLTGGVMISERKRKAKALKVKSIGLRFKFTLFIVSLIIFVVFILSNSLGLQFLNIQERLLARGLVSRVNVFLESLTSNTKAYLPSKNLLELGFLPGQLSSFEEVKYVTITGPHIQNKKAGYDFVWASNDKNLYEKIDTPGLVVGESELDLPDLENAYDLFAKLNDEAKSNLGELITGINSLTKDAINIALRTDAASIERRNEIQTVIRQMEEKMNSELASISSKGIGSYPKFDVEKLSRDTTDYLFYKPVLYGQSGNAEQFVHGVVYVEVSTKQLLGQIDESTRNSRKMILYISLISIFMGAIGAYILGSIIVSPIKALVAHIELINNTEDKSRLAGVNVSVRAKDEIGLLGTTINNMTNGLAAAAAASKDLTMGKEIQKRFLPLDVDEAGRKLTCGKLVDDKVEFFGYYEGAKGVSGDYFNYLKLDERYYAIIKCDVAGKGIPAALIMVEVATLFLDYFKDWNLKNDGLTIDYIVSRINDLIESLGFKGRFAAFTLCLFDTITGDVHFCNAGDNIINIYDAGTKKMKEVVLTEVSAAGVFPTFMIEMKGGFRVETVHLNPGDVLFLYTDGIEEAKRLFRNEQLKPVLCEEPGLKQDDPHETHSVGQDGEELGKERVCKIIESVFARQPYSLKKWHNPIPDEEFDFDFSKLEGSLEDAVLGLVSVEKVFRMYRDPAAGPSDMITVDKKIDLFLNKYFRQYQTYCANRKPNTEYEEYLYYTNIKEDDQYDDLTILGVKKK